MLGIGVQLGINNYFSTTINDQDGRFNVSGYGYDISVIPGFIIGQNTSTNSSLSLFFRLGGGYDSFSSILANQNNFVDVIGTGVRYNFNQYFTTSLQWIGRGLLTNPSVVSYSSNSVIGSIGIFF
ncbi:MAG: hypothetical protein K2P99_06650 [Burkholderiales bacterium]|nr:hypothetical protein [Burkholderiales bacterium]